MNSERVYTNQGNARLLALIAKGTRTVLDVGCGSGDNAALLREAQPDIVVYGVTRSATEAKLASTKMYKCWVFDLEGDHPADLLNHTFDCILFSHVLEHLRTPELVVAKMSQILRPGGSVLIAVPNILSWRMRWRFINGQFDYEAEGVLDETHLRFFTYETAARRLLATAPELRVVANEADGNLPLWPLRHLVSPALAKKLDEWGTERWPNLFGNQVLIKAVKDDASSYATRELGLRDGNS